jgi:hypothetical protein
MWAWAPVSITVRSAIRGFATIRGWMATAGMASREATPTSESTSIHHRVGGDCIAAVKGQTGMSSLNRLVRHFERIESYGAFVIN